MGYRDFRDSDGVQWQAWDVVPQLVERRKELRRTARSHSRKHTGANERRSGMDRRIMATRRPTLGDGMGQGWLCFESETEKRRLAPVPGDWMRCRDAKLEEYCRAALPVRRASGAVAAPMLVMEGGTAGLEARVAGPRT